MPAFEPFRAVRYAASHDLARVTAPPYDVLSDADVDALAGLDPHNVVRVDVPRGGDERYSEAAVTLNDWLATGDLVTDAEPTFTIYRRRFTDATGQPRELSGVLGALEVVDEGSGEVLAHERTTPKASTDRLELTRATHCNLSPVWCLSAYPGLSALLDAPGRASRHRHPRGCRARGRAGRRSDAYQRDPHRRRLYARAHRRRAPPVCGLAPVPGRAPRGGWRPRRGAHPGLRRRARRGPAERRGDPPALHRDRGGRPGLGLGRALRHRTRRR